MAQGDYYQIRATGLYLNLAWENVYWVYQGSAGTNANITTALAQWFEDNIYLELEPFMSDQWSLEQIVCQNWRNVSQADVIAGEAVGDVTTAGMPSWVNYTVSFNRFGAGFNYPMKRFNGVPEVNTTGNNLATGIEAGITAVMENLFSISVTGGAALGYMVLGITPPIGTNDPLGNTYRSQFPNAVRGVKLGTQKTRKS